MSTRETPNIRRETFALGVSQIPRAAAPIRAAMRGRGQPGGSPANSNSAIISDLDEVVRDVASMGYVPSFCTGCYRLGRTGQDFMDLAKPGAIKLHCDPNALSTFLNT